MQKPPVLLEPPTNMSEPFESTEHSFKKSSKTNNKTQQGLFCQHTLTSSLLIDSQLTGP